ncbi:MAG: CPP1-like family protein [Synechococcaceae cyanobacterium]|jgi:hypothetical protein
MSEGSVPPRSSQGSGEPEDPYTRLGIPHDSLFDEVQTARKARLQEVGDDQIAASRVEAAYDAILMDRLKERQQGRVSSAARSASQREQATPPPRPVLPALGGMSQLPMPRLAPTPPKLPTLAPAQGREFWFPLIADGVLLLLMLLVPAAMPELLLALATAVTLLNLQRRNGRFLAALGWSFGLLLTGLVVGAVLVSLLNASLPVVLPLGPSQVQGLPALLLLLLGALLIA